MQPHSDVNPAFAEWKNASERQKEWTLQNLINRMEKFARAICWQRLPDHADSVDALINGIVWRAIKHADTFKDEAKFSTWYYRIIVNECNRFLRNYKKRCETSLVEELPINYDGIDAKVDVLALLDGLEGEDHLLFRMVAEGHDWNVIGKALKLSSNTAHKRWQRLKEKMRNA